eukprot:2941901-Prymnesium_polylepis.1
MGAAMGVASGLRDQRWAARSAFARSTHSSSTWKRACGPVRWICAALASSRVSESASGDALVCLDLRVAAHVVATLSHKSHVLIVAQRHDALRASKGDSEVRLKASDNRAGGACWLGRTARRARDPLVSVAGPSVGAERDRRRDPYTTTGQARDVTTG